MPHLSEGYTVQHQHDTLCTDECDRVVHILRECEIVGTLLDRMKMLKEHFYKFESLSTI